MKIVIIGNGVAGMEAALAVREREPEWEITIVSEESEHFFSRTALMWVMSGQMSYRDIEPYERDLYQRLNFRRVRARATGIDTKAQEVKLAGGLEPLPYDRLLIACGSRPRPGPWQGSSLKGVGHFVTMQDLQWLEREIHGGPGKDQPPRAEAHLQHSAPDSPYLPRVFREGVEVKHPVVIGGGLIGIEAIEVLVAAGLQPRFFIREDWFWPIALSPEESQWISERMQEHGVEMHLDHEIETLVDDGTGNLAAVQSNQGGFESDLAVIAIGVMPNTEWLKESEIALDPRGGITVDAGLGTNAEGVFAAGDCAAVRWFNGAVRPEQLWYTARDQGRIAGRRLLGERAEYARGPWYNSAKLMDIEYTTAGLVNMNVEREQNWFYEEQGEVRSTTRIVVQDDRVVGFNLLGRRWDHSVLLRWIEERRSLAWVLKHLDKASFDTEFVNKLRIPDAVKQQPLAGAAPSSMKQPTVLPAA